MTQDTHLDGAILPKNRAAVVRFYRVASSNAASFTTTRLSLSRVTSTTVHTRPGRSIPMPPDLLSDMTRSFGT